MRPYPSSLVMVTQQLLLFMSIFFDRLASVHEWSMLKMIRVINIGISPAIKKPKFKCVRSISDRLATKKAGRAK